MKSRFKEDENSDKTSPKKIFFVNVLHEKKEFTDPVKIVDSS